MSNSFIVTYDDQGNIVKFPVVFQLRNLKGLCDPCPFCEKQHVHSIGSGHRSAHCDKFITNPIPLLDGTMADPMNGYYIVTIHE